VLEDQVQQVEFVLWRAVVFVALFSSFVPSFGFAEPVALTQEWQHRLSWECQRDLRDLDTLYIANDANLLVTLINSSKYILFV